MKVLLFSVLTLFATLARAKGYSTSTKDDFMFRVYAGAAVGALNGQYKNVDKGIQIGFSNYLSLGSYCPLYLQAGFEYNHIHSETYSAEEKLCNFAIPVNLCYLTTPKRVCRFEAFVGGNFRVNTVAKIVSKGEGRKSSTDFVTSDVKPVQLGMNVGAAVHVNRTVFAYRYNPDFTDFFKRGNWSPDSKSKTEYHFVTVGYSFE